jgi:hypothetical protein
VRRARRRLDPPFVWFVPALLRPVVDADLFEVFSRTWTAALVFAVSCSAAACGVHCPKLKRKPNEPRPANAENRRLSFGSNNDLRPASNFFEGHEAGAYECLTRGSSTSLKGNIACEKSRALRCVRAVGGCGRREPKPHPRHAETLSG